MLGDVLGDTMHQQLSTYALATKHSLPLCPCITFIMYPDVPLSMLLLGINEKYCLFPPQEWHMFPWVHPSLP